MPGYEQARAEIEARGGEVQTAGGGGLFAWLFGARGGGADDAEEEGGGEATGVARGGRGGGRSRGSRSRTRAGRHRHGQAQLADRPDICRPRRAGPCAQPQRPRCWAGRGRQGQAQLAGRPDLRQRRRAGAPPPVKPQARAADAASSPTLAERRCRRGGDRSRSRATPRRPLGRRSSRRCRRSGRPISTSRSRSPTLPCLRRARPIWSWRRGKGSARTRSWPAPSNKGPGLAGAGSLHGSLPPVITYGIDGAPIGALALAEGSPAQKYNDDALLARAAELTAPLPPMPIPNVGAASRGGAWQSRLRRSRAIGRDGGRGSRANVRRPAVVRRVQDDRSCRRRSAWRAVVNGCAHPLARGTRERTGAKRQVRAKRPDRRGLWPSPASLSHPVPRSAALKFQLLSSAQGPGPAAAR